MRRTAGYTWDRLQNKFTHCKGIRNNTGTRQTTGIQKELDTTCKQNVSRQNTNDNETLFPNWQKESWKTSEVTYRYMRPERVNKWPNSMTYMMMMMMMIIHSCNISRIFLFSETSEPFWGPFSFLFSGWCRLFLPVKPACLTYRPG